MRFKFKKPHYPKNLLVKFQGLDHMVYADPSIMKHMINIDMA